MNDVESVKKAFHEASIAGEKRLLATKTTQEFNAEWEKFSFTMVSFELILREMGEDF